MRPLLAALAAAFLLTLPPVANASSHQGFLVEFAFDTLWFRFHPGGLGTAGATGSGLEVFAENVRIEGDDVVDLRHCIDGHPEPQCSYGGLLTNYQGGDEDGVAEPDEVTAFQGIAAFGVQDLDKVKRLAQLLERNVTVDGVPGNPPRVAALVFRGAEGAVNSTEPAYADVTMEVTYDNDRNAARHEIHLRGLHLLAEGFAYTNARWVVVSDQRWRFRPAETEPESARGHQSDDGWSSDQATFEAATDHPLRLVVEKAPKKKTPGFEFFLAAPALAALILLRRRW